MKAMVLAAGLGTRLRPLTDDRPKALVTVAGRTLLEITLSRLRVFGVREVIVNAYHHAEMIAVYLERNKSFGMRIEVSREQELLETGGGLKHAMKFFVGDGSDPDEPFILHNVDVISSIDLKCMAELHLEIGALATLAVQDREASRYLLFDEKGQLCGRRAGHGGAAEMVRPAQRTVALGFCGIQVISPRLFLEMKQDGAFSIINTYLQLAAQREAIHAYRADGTYWRDLGRAKDLLEAEQDVENGRFSLP